MAMERNKIPYSNPKTLEESALSETPYVETTYDNGDKEFDFEPDETQLKELATGVVNTDKEFYANLAEDMDDTVLNRIGQTVLEGYRDDKNSSAEWMKTITDGMSLLGTRVEETNDPFPGACAAHHPLILESAVKFQAKASSELFNAKGPVKTAIIGRVDPDKEEQAKRVRQHMNYQIMEQMEEYFDETEMMLFYLPIVGSGFKKTYYDAQLGRPISVFVPVDHFFVNYYTTNLKTAYRYTHVLQRNHNDVLKDMKSGFYLDCDIRSSNKTVNGELTQKIDDQQGFAAPQDDQVHTLLEQYVFLDLGEDDSESDKDGIKLPYVVTVEHDTGKVLAIRRNWREDSDKRQSLCPFTHYKFVPGLGFYGLGYIHLIGNLQMTLTAAMRNLIDSGTFATLQGGFVDKRLRIRNNDGPIAPGEFKEVEAGGVELDKAIKLLPTKEPSAVLLQMYQFVEARGQKFADSMEQVLADSTNYGPVGTTMALLEASQKFFTGVHKRLHKSQKQEFQILASLNYEFLDESEEFDTVGATFEISRNDYDGRVDVVPVSDPNMGSQAQKLTLADAVKNTALQTQGIHDMRAVTAYFYESLGVDTFFVEKFLPEPEEAAESDPLTDIMTAQQGKPIKAFQGQDHDSHIQVKMAFVQDPVSGGSPAMQPVIPRIMANIQEHQVLKFKEMIAANVAMGGAQGTPEEAVVAQAAQKVTQQNQRIAQLEAQSPDTARAKLADAEVQRVANETRELEAELEDRIVERSQKSLQISLDKYKAELAANTQVIIAGMQQQADQHQTQMKEMMALLQESMQIKAAAETTDKQVEAQKESAKEKAKAKPKAKPKTP